MKLMYKKRFNVYLLAALLLCASLVTPISSAYARQSSSSHKAQTSLPDLIISMNLWMQGQTGSCVPAYGPYGLMVFIQNIGTADAGSFAVEVNGAQQTVSGLAAGANQTLWFANLASNGINTGSVDANNDVAESDETNNSTVYNAVTPTPPAICTSTPTPTPTRTQTFTPTSMPGANFAGSPLSGNAPLTVQFNHIDSSLLSRCTWSFGDGSTQTFTAPTGQFFAQCPSASHIYTSQGLYSVTLSVTKFTNGYTNSFTRYDYVEVFEAPTQTPTATPTPYVSHRLFLPSTMREYNADW